VAGTGDAEAWLRREVEARGLGHVRVLGFQPPGSIPALVRGARLCVLPSTWYECLPYSALETLAEGRPMVASRIGGLPEIVEDGVCGALVEPGDPEALREAMARLWAAPRTCRDMGAAGRQRVRERFGPEAHYEGLMQVYREVLG
jgi:glycosyltransferase involved in cell wall biosynthesis